MRDIVDRLLEQAVATAAGSPNEIRKVGAVLVTPDRGAEIAGCNSFPPGVRNLPERVVGDNRFIWLEHAERSAIFEAARRGLATDGAWRATLRAAGLKRAAHFNWSRTVAQTLAAYEKACQPAGCQAASFGFPPAPQAGSHPAE